MTTAPRPGRSGSYPWPASTGSPDVADHDLTMSLVDGAAGDDMSIGPSRQIIRTPTLIMTPCHPLKCTMTKAHGQRIMQIRTEHRVVGLENITGLCRRPATHFKHVIGALPDTDHLAHSIGASRLNVGQRPEPSSGRRTERVLGDLAGRRTPPWPAQLAVDAGKSDTVRAGDSTDTHLDGLAGPCRSTIRGGTADEKPGNPEPLPGDDSGRLALMTFQYQMPGRCRPSPSGPVPGRLCQHGWMSRDPTGGGCAGRSRSSRWGVTAKLVSLHQRCQRS